jgi:hypothetical protein
MDVDFSNPAWWFSLLASIVTATVMHVFRPKAKPADPTLAPNPPPPPDIHAFDFSDFTPLMRASIAGESKAVLVREAKALKAKPLQGRPVALMVQKMFKGLLEQFAEHPQYKDWLIALLGTVLKVDLSSLVKAKLLLIAVLLCLAGNSYAGEPRAPQRFYGDHVSLPAPEPLMWQQGKLVAYGPQGAAPEYVGVTGPDGGYHQPTRYQHVAYLRDGYGPLRGGGWWTAGPARRVLSAPVRFIGRCIRRLRGRC